MKPLTIGVDFRPALSRATGVGRYFQGLVSGLARVDERNTYVLFSSSLRERPDFARRPPNFFLVDRHVPVRVLNALWHRCGAPSLDLLTGHRIDVAHSPTPLILPSRRARSIVTVCDLFFLERPDATRREIRRDYVSLVRTHARRADVVLAISETTASDVACRLDVPRERIRVIPAGIDERFLQKLPNGREEPSRPYLLAVATEEPRKNLPALLRAVALLKKRGWEGQLWIAGGPGLDTPRVDESIHRLELDRDVRKLGYVDADALPSLYRRARAVVMPSLWEGFGLPLLEAMAAEAPIVCSDIPVHHEVAGEAALYVAPEDSQSVADGIERLWSDASLRSRLVREGRKRVSLFSWEASARKALALYREVGGDV